MQIFSQLFLLNYAKDKTQNGLPTLCPFPASRRRKNSVAMEFFPRRDAGKIPSWRLSLTEDEVGQVGVGSVAFETW